MSTDDDADEIAEAQRLEVLRRRHELIANPGLAQQFDDEYFNRLRKLAAEIRAGNRSALESELDEVTERLNRGFDADRAAGKVVRMPEKE